MISQNSAGQFSYTLVRYNTTQYAPEALLPLPTPQDGGELAYQMFRWGQDGLVLLAYDNSFGVTAPSAQLILLRGPFVLPAELAPNPAPTLLSVNPSSITVNSGNTTLTVTGTNFIPGAVALWGGQARSTTYTDNAHVSVAIPAADLKSVQTVNLTVQNPDSPASNALSVSIH
jgi:hypothetical protein